MDIRCQSGCGGGVERGLWGRDPLVLSPLVSRDVVACLELVLYYRAEMMLL